jgi:hypothetical protein
LFDDFLIKTSVYRGSPIGMKRLMTAQEAIRLFSDIHPINRPVLTGRRRQESQEEQAEVEAWSRCDGLDRQQLDD